LGAAIEQCFDDKGIMWPVSIAPFQVVLCPMSYDRSDMVREASDKLYQELTAAGIEVIMDDRGERPGAMFADWELIGVPYRIVIGERGLKEGQLEFQARTDAEATNVPVAEVLNRVREAIQAKLN
jgi:prolyl-tRNA synthetase